MIMKRVWLMFVLSLFSFTLFAEEAAPAKKKVDFNNVRRWGRNTCARSSSIKWDDKEKAIVVTADFKDRTENCWCYPTFRFRPNEDISKATGIRYDIKLGADSYALTGSHLVMLKISDREKNKYLKVENAGDEWKTVTVKFNETSEELKKASYINIGMHSEDQVLVFMLRNIELVTE